MNNIWDLTQMTKVEIVISGEDMPVIVELLSEVGATGFTALSNVSGLGHSGYHQGRLLFNDRNALTMLTVVLPGERATALINGIRPLLSDRSGVLFVYPVRPKEPNFLRGSAEVFGSAYPGIGYEKYA